MAIKPGDTILNLDYTMVPGKNMFGEISQVPKYPSYWDKFTTHINEQTKTTITERQRLHCAIPRKPGDFLKQDWGEVNNKLLSDGLAKYSGVYKTTKKGKEYIKFAHPEGLSMFVMIWG